MSQLKGAAVIGQSGGPSAVINASAYGAIKTALESDAITHVYGMQNGILGLLNDDLRGKQLKAMFFGGIMGPIMGNTSQISYALTAGIGGALCALGRFDVGGLAIFVNYSRQFSRPINEISQQMATVFSALAGAIKSNDRFLEMVRHPLPDVFAFGAKAAYDTIVGPIRLSAHWSSQFKWGAHLSLGFDF